MKAFSFFVLITIIMTIAHNSRANDVIVSCQFNTDTMPGAILIINSFDAMSIRARNNKRELFRELTDSLKEWLARAIKRQTGKEARIIPGILSKANELDSVVFSLMNQYGARTAILIWSGNVHFEETGTKEVEKYGGDTETEISYDMCAKYEYTLYDSNKNLKQSTIDNCEYFTTRTSAGKRIIISIGPDIVGKKKHTYNIVDKNADKYIYQVAGKLY